jgi:hypothetical protein
MVLMLFKREQCQGGSLTVKQRFTSRVSVLRQKTINLLHQSALYARR